MSQTLMFVGTAKGQPPVTILNESSHLIPVVTNETGHSVGEVDIVLGILRGQLTILPGSLHVV